ncbi:hypothetical protein [Georgenia faecalis]|uniref:hypothetical protein n=1 Tax=Georgenia faecalis TaxID=2483799 RepID=UPI000FDBE46F|nr:hypothetical protein [Georgenia faecalis]
MSPTPRETGLQLTAEQRAGGEAGFDAEWDKLSDTDRVAVCAHIAARGLEQAMRDFDVAQEHIDHGLLPGLYVEACRTVSVDRAAPIPPASPADAPSLTDQEQAFVDNHRDEFTFSPPKSDGELIAWAKERCTEMTEEHAEDRVEFIGSRWSGGSDGAQNMRVVAGTFCPSLLPDMNLADRAFGPGNYVAVAEQSDRPTRASSATPGQVAPGTYGTLRAGVEDCYWERTSASGSTIANDFLSFVPGSVTVTINAGEGFTSTGCGIWVPAA